jgi:hypothetical protein
MLRKNAISTIRTNGHNLRRTDLLALLHQNLLKKKAVQEHSRAHASTSYFSLTHQRRTQLPPEKKLSCSHSHSRSQPDDMHRHSRFYHGVERTRACIGSWSRGKTVTFCHIQRSKSTVRSLSTHKRSKTGETAREGEREDWRRAG